MKNVFLLKSSIIVIAFILASGLTLHIEKVTAADAPLPPEIMASDEASEVQTPVIDSDIKALVFKGDEQVLRMQLEARIGSVAATEMSADARTITVTFNPGMGMDLGELIAQTDTRHSLLKQVSVSESPEGGQALIVEFAQPLSVLDETLAATSETSSRWEVVLTSSEVPDAPLIDESLPSPSLDSIAVSTVGGMLAIELDGSAGLVAEVSFSVDPPRFLVELPGIPVEDLARHEKSFNSENKNPDIKGVLAGVMNDGAAGLMFELAQPMDMIDAAGQILDETGQIVLSLVPDNMMDGTGVGAEGIAAAGGALKGIDITEERNKLSLALEGIQGVKVNAYVLKGPPRLMIDFMGWKPEQVYEAVSKFNPVHPVIAGIRYGQTRLGSARVEIELAADTQLLDTMTRKGFDSNEESFIVSLQTPDKLSWDTEVMLARGDKPLDLRYHPEYDFSREPEILVRPVELEGASGYDDGESVRSGGRYELIGFYEKALENDNIYHAARSNYQADIEVYPQARSGYLPQATFDYRRSRIRQDINKASNASFPTGVSSYTTKGWSLTITQPIIDMSVWNEIDQSKVRVRQAKVSLLASEQDLIMRVAEAYLNLLASRDTLQLAQTELTATQKQYEFAKTRFRGGLNTRAEVSDAEGRVALAEAREIESVNLVDDARAALKEIIGQDVDSVLGFKGDFTPSLPYPAKVDPWVTASLEQNLTLQSRRMEAQVASLEVKRQRSGHLPTLTAVGSVGNDVSGGSLYGTGQDVTDYEVGLQLSVPIFSGGRTSSLVRQAIARSGTAKFERDQERLTTERVVRSTYSSISTSVKKIQALRKMVIAQDKALQQHLAGLKAGIENVITVLDSFRLYYESRHDFMKARYQYLVNRLRLKQAVGTLNRNDLEDIGSLIN